MGIKKAGVKGGRKKKKINKKFIQEGRRGKDQKAIDRKHLRQRYLVLWKYTIYFKNIFLECLIYFTEKLLAFF